MNIFSTLKMGRNSYWDISAVELGTRLRDAATTTDFPRMLKPIEPREWQEFFVQEAAKLKSEIFE